MTWHDEREPAVYAAGEPLRVSFEGLTMKPGETYEIVRMRRKPGGYVAECRVSTPEVPGLPTLQMAEAMRLLRGMKDEQRAQIFCWFCRGCSRYVGPGDNCHCENDE